MASREQAVSAPGRSWASFVRLVRIVLVASISVFYVGTTLPNIVLPWYPMGHFGFDLDVAGNVIEVDPGSPASRAGIRVGDRNDFAATPVAARRFQYSGISDQVWPGTHAVYVFDRGGKRIATPLIAEVDRQSFADNASNILLVLSEVAPALIGAWLLLQRPSCMTWAFFLYTTGTPLLCTAVIASVPTAGVVALYVFEAPIAFQSLWLFIFALRFPGDAAPGWRGIAERATIVALVVLIPFNFWDLDGALLGLPPPPAIVAFFAALGVWGLVAAALTFLLTYFHSTKGDRARVRFVMLGLVVGYSGQLAFNLLLELPNVHLPDGTFALTASMQIFVAIAVAYAVIRHRVFDVRFFIARAVVYAMLTAAVVSFLSLVDLAAGKLLSGTGLAAIGEAGLAIVVGLGLNGVHKRVEALVASTLFRSRIEAQARLRRVARDLGRSATLDVVEGAIVREPAAAFALTSVALFRREASGAFVRGESIGWENASLATIEPSHPLVVRLLASSESIAIASLPFVAGVLPADDLRPSFAMPVVVRSNIEAIVFYGPHANHEELDPAEVETLERLLADASAAFDHVRAELAERRVRELEDRVALLMARRVPSAG